ncbi:MAG: hypothetical protein IAG13_20080 [Deltaproteobacteria bacterium]|nr:hypothetical protein [Nannocystaceae bacterium]
MVDESAEAPELPELVPLELSEPVPLPDPLESNPLVGLVALGSIGGPLLASLPHAAEHTSHAAADTRHHLELCITITPGPRAPGTPRRSYPAPVPTGAVNWRFAQF